MQAALAARGVATVPIRQRGHPHACRYTAVPPSLLRTTTHAAGLAGDGRWKVVQRGLGGTVPAKADAVPVLARMAGVGTRKTVFCTSVLSDGTGIVFFNARPAAAAETVATATAHVRRRTGDKRQGGAAPSIESQVAAMGLDLSDASLLVFKMRLHPAKNGVATAASDGPKRLDVLPAARAHAHRR